MVDIEKIFDSALGRRMDDYLGDHFNNLVQSVLSDQDREDFSEVLEDEMYGHFLALCDLCSIAGYKEGFKDCVKFLVNLKFD